MSREGNRTRRTRSPHQSVKIFQLCSVRDVGLADNRKPSDKDSEGRNILAYRGIVNDGSEIIAVQHTFPCPEVEARLNNLLQAFCALDQDCSCGGQLCLGQGSD